MSKFTVFVGSSESGVAWWRAKQPAYKLMEKGLCDVKMYSVYDTVNGDEANLIAPADLIYIPSPAGIEIVCELIRYFETGKKSVVDYDDNMFDCHYLNPGYKTLGQKEVLARLPDGTKQYVWQDERNGFSLKFNKMRHDSYIDILNIVDGVTTTTQHLKNEIYTGMNDRKESDISIVPNSIDFNIFRRIKHKNTSDKIRIGWTASDSHILETQIMLKIVDKLLAKRNDFQFVILGNIQEARQSKNVASLPIEWHSFVDLGIYAAKLASLELDIAICPLEDVSFNRCKSQLKWSEFSSLAIPTVCQNLEPYHCVIDGKDGLLASNPDEFVEKIELLMDNAKLRKEIGENALERTHQDFNLDEVVYDWYEVFERVLSNDRTLTYKGKEIKRFDRPKEVPV